MKKTVILILIAIILIGSAGAFAAHQVNFIDLSPVFAKVPFMHGLVKKPAEDPEELLTSPIEEENKQLREENSELQSKITSLEEEKTKLMEQVTEIQNEVNSLKAEKNDQKETEINTQKLAEYYREMEPKAAVKIMENLDDETILLLLSLLEKKQSGEIISLMDPQRAAFLTTLLLQKGS